MNIEDVCTDKDLEDELLSYTALQNLQTEPGKAKKARQQALDDVLEHFYNQVPTINASDFSRPLELKRVVTFGALARLYRGNLTTGGGDDVNAAKHKAYRDLYAGALAALKPTVAGTTQRAAPPTIALHRR